jgi:hypothetical protein
VDQDERTNLVDADVLHFGRAASDRGRIVEAAFENYDVWVQGCSLARSEHGAQARSALATCVRGARGTPLANERLSQGECQALFSNAIGSVKQVGMVDAGRDQGTAQYLDRGRLGANGRQ